MASQQALATAAGVSMRTVGSLERGDPVAFATLHAVERALGWRAGAASDVLAGDQPEERPARQPTRQPSSVLDEIRAASPEELVKMRHMYAEFRGAKEADEWLSWAIRLQRGDIGAAAETPAAG